VILLDATAATAMTADHSLSSTSSSLLPYDKPPPLMSSAAAAAPPQSNTSIFSMIPIVMYII
jgi:hypothetical protein